MKKMFAVLCAFLIIPLFANDDLLAKAFKAFQTGSYQEAVLSLKKINSNNRKLMGTRFYLEGMCHNRTQRFELAMNAFKKSIQYKNTTKDLQYEYGQALFANSELERGRNAFIKSYKLGHKAPMSLYYAAHISQILEEHNIAKKYYLKLLSYQKKIPKGKRDIKLAQIAQFQLSESLVVLAEKKNELTAKKAIESKIIPLMKKAIKIIPKAPIATDIKKRIEDLEKKYFLNPNLMKNGKVLSEKRWSLDYSQEVTYDSNITLSTNQTASAATQEDSFIHYTTFSGDYLWQVNNRYLIEPSAKFKNTYHGDRQNSSAYKNDAYNIAFALEGSRQHKLFNKKSSLSFKVNHSYIAQDYDSKKEKGFYSRATTYTIGHKFKYFSAGNTGLKIKYKDLYGYLMTLHKRTKTFSLDQLIITKKGKLIILLAQADFADNYNNITQSTDTFLFRIDWLAPEFWPKYTLNLAMAVTITDTKLQKATRGTEKTYNPSIKITKKVRPNLSLTAGLSLTRNISLDTANYEYDKHSTNFELKYDF